MVTINLDRKKDCTSHPLIFVLLDRILLLLGGRPLSSLEVVERFGEVCLQPLSLQFPLPEHTTLIIILLGPVLWWFNCSAQHPCQEQCHIYLGSRACSGG